MRFSSQCCYTPTCKSPGQCDFAVRIDKIDVIIAEIRLKLKIRDTINGRIDIIFFRG